MARSRKPCRVCTESAGQTMQVSVSRAGAAHTWQLFVCRDCWRAFEAMLDQGAPAQQYDLTNQSGQRPVWFL